MSSRTSRWLVALPGHLIRYGLVALGAASAPGCTSEGGGGTDPGSISLSITTTSATVMPGGSQPVAASLTRIGGFTGPVTLYVTGQPDGVTAAVSDIQTSGPVTTATVTVSVGAVAAGSYPLVVHGSGNGVSEATAAFTLTVAAPDLGFSVSLSTDALWIMRGASTPTTTVNISRERHLGAVELEVTGLPVGVTASFGHATPWLTGDSSVLTLTVGTNAATGTYNLRVAASDPEQIGFLSTPLALTVTADPVYTLTLAASALSSAQGTSTLPTAVNLIRGAFTGNVSLSVENLPTGVQAYFYPANPIAGTTTQLWLFVAGTAATGTFTNLIVRGVASGIADRIATLSLTITVAPFSLTLSSPTLSIAQGTATPTITVNLVRQNFAGPVTLWVDIGDFHGTMPAGVTATFAPNITTGDSSVLTITVSASAVPGIYTLYLYGEAATGYFEGPPLTLTVIAAP